MDRRRFLATAGATGALAATGGCIDAVVEDAEHVPPVVEDRFDPAEVDLPVHDRHDVAVDAIGRAAGAAPTDVDALEAVLAGEEIRVEAADLVEVDWVPTLELEYRVADAVERGLLDHLGLVAGAYAAVVAAGEGGERLEATLLDDAGETYGEYEVEADWAEAFDDGELSARAYADEVMVTAESS